MVNTVSLLPGTLSTELNADSLTVHALDTESNLVPELMMVEQAVARMFAVSLKNGEKVEPDGAP
jgi:multicomponent Na+:H+ antiporter subunit E